MSLYVPDSLAVGSTVELSFVLPPEDTPLGLRAAVRNRRGFRYGLEFDNIPPSELFAIKRYLGTVEAAAEAGA
jgi:hypothetical protein